MLSGTVVLISGAHSLEELNGEPVCFFQVKVVSRSGVEVEHFYQVAGGRCGSLKIFRDLVLGPDSIKMLGFSVKCVHKEVLVNASQDRIAVGRTPARFSTPGILAATENHWPSMHKQLRAILKQHLSIQLTLLDGLNSRHADAKTVGTYRGGTKFSNLEDWLSGFAVMLEAIQYGGDDQDCE
jgi:hypothetical protein